MAEKQTRESATTQLIFTNVRVGDLIAYTPYNRHIAGTVRNYVTREGNYVIVLQSVPSGRDFSGHYEFTITNNTTAPMHPFTISVNPTEPQMLVDVERFEPEPTTAPEPFEPANLHWGHDEARETDIEGNLRVMGQWVGVQSVTISRGMDCYELLRKLEQMDITKKNKLALADLINRKVTLGTGKPKSDLATTKRKIRIGTNEKNEI